MPTSGQSHIKNHFKFHNFASAFAGQELGFQVENGKQEEIISWTKALQAYSFNNKKKIQHRECKSVFIQRCHYNKKGMNGTPAMEYSEKNKPHFGHLKHILHLK